MGTKFASVYATLTFEHLEVNLYKKKKSQKFSEMSLENISLQAGNGSSMMVSSHGQNQ